MNARRSLIRPDRPGTFDLAAERKAAAALSSSPRVCRAAKYFHYDRANASELGRFFSLIPTSTSQGCAATRVNCTWRLRNSVFMYISVRAGTRCTALFTAICILALSRLEIRILGIRERERGPRRSRAAARRSSPVTSATFTSASRPSGATA